MATRLEVMPTKFVRLIGHGTLPPLTKPVSYKLCVDFSTKSLKSAQSIEDDDQPEEEEEGAGDEVEGALRKWSWSTEAGTPIETVVCWHERFTPHEAKGTRWVGAEATGPFRYFRLGEGHDELSDTQTDADSFPILRLIEEKFSRKVVVAPWLGVDQPSRPSAKPNGPTKYLDTRKVAGIAPHLPDWVKIRYRGFELVGIYKMCINLEGNVAEVIPIVRLPAGNVQVMDTLRTWKYKPQPVPVCFVNKYVFGIY
jgi:hypothetical protein